MYEYTEIAISQLCNQVLIQRPFKERNRYLQDYLLDSLGTNDADAKSIISKGQDTQNFLQVQIYFEELNFEKITESEAYTVR